MSADNPDTTAWKAFAAAHTADEIFDADIPAPVVPGTREALLDYLDIFLHPNPQVDLSGLVCKHGVAIEACPSRECANPIAYETAIKRARDYIAALAPVPPTDGAPVSVDNLRKTIADEWGSHVCYYDRVGTRTCNKADRCRCADIARAILASYSFTPSGTGAAGPVAEIADVQPPVGCNEFSYRTGWSDGYNSAALSLSVQSSATVEAAKETEQDFEDRVMAALRSAGLAKRPLIVTKWKDSIDIDEPSYDALRFARALLSSAPEATVSGEASLPTYGNLPWDQLGRDVMEAMSGQRIDFRFGPGYPGHDMPGINFNSLARIVDKYRASPQDVGREATIEELLCAATRMRDLLTADGEPPSVIVPEDTDDPNDFIQAFDDLATAIRAISRKEGARWSNKHASD